MTNQVSYYWLEISLPERNTAKFCPQSNCYSLSVCIQGLIYLIISITDRYLAISRPLIYVPVRTQSLVLVWILAVNILSVLVSAPVLFAWSDSLGGRERLEGDDQV